MEAAVESIPALICTAAWSCIQNTRELVTGIIFLIGTFDNLLQCMCTMIVNKSPLEIRHQSHAYASAYHSASINSNFHNNAQQQIFTTTQVWNNALFKIVDQGDNFVQLQWQEDGGVFPGDLVCKVTYTLSPTALEIRYEARTTQTTPVSFTNHNYW